MIAVWVWYHPAAKIGRESWLRTLYSSLWPNDLVARDRFVIGEFVRTLDGARHTPWVPSTALPHKCCWSCSGILLISSVNGSESKSTHLPLNDCWKSVSLGESPGHSPSFSYFCEASSARRGQWFELLQLGLFKMLVVWEDFERRLGPETRISNNLRHLGFL